MLKTKKLLIFTSTSCNVYNIHCFQEQYVQVCGGGSYLAVRNSFDVPIFT
jgi:hypothetical protein